MLSMWILQNWTALVSQCFRHHCLMETPLLYTLRATKLQGYISINGYSLGIIHKYLYSQHGRASCWVRVGHLELVHLAHLPSVRCLHLFCQQFPPMAGMPQHLYNSGRRLPTNSESRTRKFKFHVMGSSWGIFKFEKLKRKWPLKFSPLGSVLKCRSWQDSSIICQHSVTCGFVV